MKGGILAVEFALIEASPPQTQKAVTTLMRWSIGLGIIIGAAVITLLRALTGV